MFVFCVCLFYFVIFFCVFQVSQNGEFFLVRKLLHVVFYVNLLCLNVCLLLCLRAGFLCPVSKLC